MKIYIDKLQQKIASCISTNAILSLLLEEIDRQTGIPDLITDLDFLPLPKTR
jgi:hypothetical protein